MIRLALRALVTAAALVLPLAARAQTAAPANRIADPARALPAPDNTGVPAPELAPGTAPAAAPVLARATFPLATGDQVRLVTAAGRYNGKLTQVTADTLTLAAPGRSNAVLMADVSHVQRLVSRESRGRSILRGAGLGVLAGAALGYVAGTGAGNKQCETGGLACSPGHDRTAQAAFTADGAILGALLGAMIGPTFRRSRWEQVEAAPAASATLPAPVETASGSH